jgi:hypothetical protein
VRVVGTSRDHVRIDGNGASAVVTISAANVTLKQLTVQDGETGILLDGAWGSGATHTTLALLRVRETSTGVAFANAATLNNVTDLEVSGATYGVNVGDQSSSGNTFLRAKLHDNLVGLIAYAGSDNLVLRDSTVSWNEQTGVQVGWSTGWVLERNQIYANGNGIVTDTASGMIRDSYIARNGQWGIYEGGFYSTNTILHNRIDSNVGSGVALCTAAVGNDVQQNMVFNNGRYGVEICNHPDPSYENTGNHVHDNYLIARGANLGDAVDEEHDNTWAANYYGANPTGSAPYTVPGAAGAIDGTPLDQSSLPTPASDAQCLSNGWWFLTNGTYPFVNQTACTAFAI